MAKKTRAALWIFVTLALAGLMLVHPVAAAQPRVVVKLAPKATLVEAGQAVLLRVMVRCPQGFEVLEAFVYVTQDGSTSQFAGLPVQCNGKMAEHTARIEAFEESPFQLGEATATGFVLLAEGDLSGDEFRAIQIK